IHHLLLARLVERDGELVAVNHDDVAVAEFLMKHPVADGELGGRAGRLGDQLALDGERAGAAGGGGAAPAAPTGHGPPRGRGSAPWSGGGGGSSGARSSHSWLSSSSKPLGRVVRFCARCQPGVP